MPYSSTKGGTGYIMYIILYVYIIHIIFYMYIIIYYMYIYYMYIILYYATLHRDRVYHTMAFGNPVVDI